MLVFLSLGVVFLGAFVAPAVCRGERGNRFLALPPLAAFVLLCADWFSGGAARTVSLEWFPALGVSFDLRLDGLSALMALLVTGIGTLVALYSVGYLKGHDQFARFSLYLLLFMGSMLGLVLADNLILLFVFWELTSITSYLLIGFHNEDETSRKKALQALLVTGGGAVAMLAGFVLIGNVAGTYRISEITGMGGVLRDSPLYAGIVVLVLLGAFTKSAQVPFHFWLPNAMVAPTPVSAYLHSATMVKGGVFLLARLNPALGETALWSWSLVGFGGATLLMAVCLGLFQTDLKKILAYTTLGVLGLLTMLIGLGTPLAIQSMVVFLLGHALYKAALFLAAGSVDHGTGTRDVSVLRGLRRAMPLTAAAALLAALSKAGFPPFLGFLGKEYVYKSGLAMEGFASVALPVAFAGNLVMLALAFKAGVSPFFGKPPPEGALPHRPHESPASLWFGPLLLGATGLVLGLAPALIDGSLAAPAVAAVLGSPAGLHLKVWHGFNAALLLSGLTLAGGLGLYSLRHRFWRLSRAFNTAVRPVGAEAVYDRLMDGLVRFSRYQTRLLQSGYLHDYVFLIALTTIGLLGVGFAALGGLPNPFGGIEWPPFLPAGLALGMMVSVVFAVATTNRITALVNLGVVGFGIALLFVYFGAPDLAITQVLVETLTVVLLMFAIYRLPTMRHLSARRTRLRDATVAAVFGLSITLLVLVAGAIQVDAPISEGLAAMSYPIAHGRDIVNVILVDFRALDTLGEITVLAVAALGVAAMVARGRRARGKGGGR
jgi:multicomponent Na+:H+ antiporter subunit A